MQSFGQGLRGHPERLPRVVGKAAQSVGEAASLRLWAAGELGGGEPPENPVGEEAELERSTPVRPALAMPSRGHQRRDGENRLGVTRGGEQGGGSPVRTSHERDLAGAERLRRDPGDRVLAVVGLLGEWSEHALEFKASPHVLHDDVEAGGDGSQGLQPRAGDRRHGVRPVVWRPLQDDGPRLPVGGGVNVCEEPDPVAHRDADTTVDDDLHVGQPRQRKRSTTSVFNSTPSPGPSGSGPFRRPSGWGS